MAARGAKEGNNALNKVNCSFFFTFYYLRIPLFQDSMLPLLSHSVHEVIQYALKNNCSRQVYDLLFEANNRSVNKLFHSSFFYF